MIVEITAGRRVDGASTRRRPEKLFGRLWDVDNIWIP